MGEKGEEEKKGKKPCKREGREKRKPLHMLPYLYVRKGTDRKKKEKSTRRCLLLIFRSAGKEKERDRGGSIATSLLLYMRQRKEKRKKNAGEEGEGGVPPLRQVSSLSLLAEDENKGGRHQEEKRGRRGGENDCLQRNLISLSYLSLSGKSREKGKIGKRKKKKGIHRTTCPFASRSPEKEIKEREREGISGREERGDRMPPCCDTRS